MRLRLPRSLFPARNLLCSSRRTLQPCLYYRFFSTQALPTEALVARYEQHGAPEKVLQLKTEPLKPLGPNDVLVEMLMAPINPADINMIEGVYPVRPPLPAIAGNEGLGLVLAVGSNVTRCEVDDWVIPAKPGFGTWRTHVVCSSDDVFKVPQDIKPEYAACLSVNPSTAVRLLEDFVPLKQGDVIIQNGANSTVGQSVIQLAKLRGVKTINVIRERVNFEETVERMKFYGADVVITDTDLMRPEFQSVLSDLPKPKLALNCVGGQSATDIARLLGEDGVMVTYGGMSKKPVQVPTSLLIFKNITLKGFWLTRWAEEHTLEERLGVIKSLWELVREKKFRLWLERYIFKTHLMTALKRMGEQRDRKVMLVMKPHRYVNREDD